MQTKIAVEPVVKSVLQGGYRVLLVDSDDAMRRRHAQEMKNIGWIVEEATSDKEAKILVAQSRTWHALFMRVEESSEVFSGGAPFTQFNIGTDLEVPIIVHSGERFLSVLSSSSNTAVGMRKPQSLTEVFPGTIATMGAHLLAQRYLTNGLTPAHRIAYFKMGGSVYDQIADGKDDEAVERAAVNICAFHQAHPEIPIFISPGNGPAGNVLSAWRKRRNPPVSLLNLQAQRILLSQSEVLRDVLGQDIAEILNPDPLEPHDEVFPGSSFSSTRVVDAASFENKPIKILPYAPKQMRVLPLLYDGEQEVDPGKIFQSDVQTLACASFFGVRDVVFIKNTEAIYAKDPEVHGRDPLVNPRFELISSRDFIEGATTVRFAGHERRVPVSRFGIDGRDDHLCEQGALRYMALVGPERIFVTSWDDDWSRKGNPAERVYVENNPEGISRIVRSHTSTAEL